MSSKNKSRMLLSAALLLLTAVCSLSISKSARTHDRIADADGRLQNPVALFEGPEDEDASNVMVPIPMRDRVFNKTGIQCVWASLECLGRYAGERKLTDLTSLPDCKSYSSPPSAARKLRELGVRFEQTVSRGDRSLIRRAVVEERRGVLFDIPGHAMVLVHYDEQRGIVKYINNSDSSLKVRTWSMEEFNRRWDGWVCAVYADEDIIPWKGAAAKIRIVDMEMSGFVGPKDYVLMPR